MCNSGALSTLTHLCNLHHHSLPELRPFLSQARSPKWHRSIPLTSFSQKLVTWLHLLELNVSSIQTIMCSTETWNFLVKEKICSPKTPTPSSERLSSLACSYSLVFGLLSVRSVCVGQHQRWLPGVWCLGDTAAFNCWWWALHLEFSTSWYVP